MKLSHLMFMSDATQGVSVGADYNGKGWVRSMNSVTLWIIFVSLTISLCRGDKVYVMTGCFLLFLHSLEIVNSTLCKNLY